MYRRVMLTTLLACTALQAFAQPSPVISFRIVETDPSSRMTLGARQPFYLRIAYKTDVPVRFRAQGYSQGALIERGASYNPAPVYPAGDGEAVAWLAFGGEVRIDEIRVTAHDERWREVAIEALPTDASRARSVTSRTESIVARRSRISWVKSTATRPKPTSAHRASPAAPNRCGGAPGASR